MKSQKRNNSVGYFSSYDRGLECLLDMWPLIREQVPGATLSVYYGWQSFDAVHSGNPEMMRWKYNMIRKMKQTGVTEHGRVSHTELAEAMKKIKIWAYPTEFTEIHCITALKAAEAGCWAVHTGVAALKETAVGAMVEGCDIYTNPELQAKFVDAVVAALKQKEHKPARKPNRYWSDVAKTWKEVIC